MMKYKERLKQKQDKNTMTTRREAKEESERKKKQADYKRKYRPSLSSQKKRRIREKDAERKRIKRKTTAKSRQAKSVDTHHINTVSSKPIPEEGRRKAIYRAKKSLPKSPLRFANVRSHQECNIEKEEGIAR